MQVKYKTTPHSRKFGIELEVSPTIHKEEIGKILYSFEHLHGKSREVRVTPGTKGWDNTNSNGYWHVKYDSTCGPVGKPIDYGWEIASFIGNTEKDLEDICKAADLLTMMGVETNDNCGLHIHVDISDFCPEDVGLLLAMWLKIEFHVMAACAKRRINNPYCQFLNIRRITQNAVYNPASLNLFWEAMAPRNLTVHENADKRYSVNTIGYRTGQMVSDYSRKTVEFRFPECVLNSEHIGGWTRLLLCFVDQCQKIKIAPESIQKAESLAEVLSIIGIHGKEEFLFLDEHLCNTKIWFLRKIIQENSTGVFASEANDLLAFMLEI